jgi:endonuclease G, mitochondrial
VKLFSFLIFLITANITVAISKDYRPLPANNLIKHTYYTLSYNTEYKQANWVYYTLTDSMITDDHEERNSSFKIDNLGPKISAKSSDYVKCGYDRGHLCPAADMSFNSTAMRESFLMTNISPQTPEFNRGIWKELETTVRKWAKKEHEIVVVTGPVFTTNKGTIGKDRILVPGKFFKIIYDSTDDPRLIAFLLPNEKSDRPLTDFAVTTDEVEKMTGFDFFSQLPDNIENQLEGKVELAGWFEGYHTTEPVAVKQAPTQQPAAQRSEMTFYIVLISVVLLVTFFVILMNRKRS